MEEFSFQHTGLQDALRKTATESESGRQRVAVRDRDRERGGDGIVESLSVIGLVTKDELAKIHERLASLEADTQRQTERQRGRERQGQRGREAETECGEGDGSDRDSEGLPDVWPKVG